MTLNEVLILSEYNGQSAATIAAAMAVFVDGEPDHTLYSSRQFSVVLNDDVEKMTLVASTILAAAETNALVKLYSTPLGAEGIDWTKPSVKTMVTSLAAAGNWPDDVTAAIRSIGTTPGKYQWQILGLSALPTEAEIADAITQLGTQQWWGTTVNEVVNPMLSQTGVTKAAVKSAVAGS